MFTVKINQNQVVFSYFSICFFINKFKTIAIYIIGFFLIVLIILIKQGGYN